VALTPAMPVPATVVPGPAVGKTAAMAVAPQPGTVLMRGVPAAAGAVGVVVAVRPVAVAVLAMAAVTTTAALRASRGLAATTVV